jgi:hypothetical protein
MKDESIDEEVSCLLVRPALASLAQHQQGQEKVRFYYLTFFMNKNLEYRFLKSLRPVTFQVA